jgi:hypothetical protein
LELPIVAFAPLWKPLVSKGIASCIITALFQALSVGYLLYTFMRFKIPKAASLFVTLIYACHPYIFYYGANGMSEDIFMFFLIYCVCNLTLWLRDGTAGYISKMAFGLAGGFLVRYETIPFAAGLGICVILNILCNQEQKIFWNAAGKKKERYFYVEATLAMLYTPAIYAGIVWIMICWAITGNPLYFFNSSYSNSAQSTMAAKVTSIMGLAKYVGFRAMPFLTFFLAVVLIRIIRRRLLRSDFFCLLILVMSLLGFHTFMYWHGSSFGWLRFFCYSLPICAAWMPYEMSVYEKEEGRLRPLRTHYSNGRHYASPRLFSSGSRSLMAVLPISLLVSALLLNNVMEGRSVADYDGSTHGQENEIVDYINDYLPDKMILTDVFTTYYIAVNVDHFDNLVVSSSLNFKKCVANPVDNGVEYLLVPDPHKVNFDAVDTAYPDLYAHGADWCVEEKNFGDFKLFRVTG